MKRLMMTIMTSGAVALSPVVFAKEAENAAKPMDQQVVSYALGAELGDALRTQEMKVNTKQLAEGLSDAYQGKKLKHDKQAINQALVQFREQQIDKQREKMNEIATKNAELGKTFIEKYAGEKGVQKTASGIHYKILTKGKGKKPQTTDMVEVNYEGKFIDGQVFDSSYQRGSTAEFRLNQVIKGWTEALQLMSEGSTWEIVIPSDLAYGPNGMGGMIGPNETLVFKVELVKVKDSQVS